MQRRGSNRLAQAGVATGQTTDDEIPPYQLILGNWIRSRSASSKCSRATAASGGSRSTKEDAYRAYVEKLLRHEDADPPTQAGGLCSLRCMMEHGRRDQDTTPGHTGNAACAAQSDGTQAPGQTTSRRQDDTTRDELFAQVSESDPTVLFTLSHGAGAPGSGWKSAERQRREQGAMSFGSDGLLYGSDIADKTSSPGGVWFMLACYGAGTPDRSAYKHWLEALSQLGQYRDSAATVLKVWLSRGGRPFVAAPRRQRLSNPNGPLAFVGHVDLAWTYSFREFDAESAVNRPQFVQLVNYALAGNRCGMMMEPRARGRCNQ